MTSELSRFDTGTDTLLVQTSDGVATITFNRPEKHNALSVEMQAALPAALSHVDSDPGARVLVVRGAGDKAFVSGADISEFGERRTSAEARADYDQRSAEVARAWATFSKPIIAMVHGYCIGGGLLTALQADIRIAAEGSQFAIPAARLGLGYAFNGVEALAAVVGNAWAAEILFTARRLSAAEALHIGLVNRVVPADELAAAVDNLAQSIAANAPLTVAACKAALRELRRPREKRDVPRLAAMVDACFRSEDYREGQQAFAERRAPLFQGR
jgi:enoyl-CoA hydratase/carnithine racemase